MESIFKQLKKVAGENPTGVFLSDAGGEITYSEAFAKIKALAMALMQKGLKKQPIILSVERNVETVLAFLGIAVSGNYYVPIDKNISEGRLASIIQSSGAKYAMNLAKCDINFFVGDLPCREILDFCELTETKGNGDICEQAAGLDDVLYLIYTSGSTGVPKGVIKSHRNIISFVNNFIETFQLAESEIIANQTPFSFDASAKDVYLTLALGGTLHIPDKALFSFPTKIVEFLNEKKVTFLCWVPSALSIIVKTRTFLWTKPTTLKYVFFVGETFPPKYLNAWLEALPHIRYINLYGSTEIAGIALFYEVKTAGEANVPIGKPLANNTVYLDRDGQICIRSEQTAIGYLNQKNDGVFQDGVLHTGDYGVYNTDGNIVFLSRKDFQIKDMGYRVELQEIEAVIQSLEYVDSVCCLYDSADRRIVAFVALVKKIADPVKTVLLDVKPQLPAYMLPGKVIVLDKLPLNTNGKIDRQELKHAMEIK